MPLKRYYNHSKCTYQYHHKYPNYKTINSFVDWLFLGLLQRLEEETRANSYIVKERLPKDIESRKKTVVDLQRVVAEPAMGQGDLDELHNKVKVH